MCIETPSTIAKEKSDSFQKQSDALAAANAGAAHAVARVASFKLINKRRGESSPGRTEGVTDRDRATVDVYFFPIKGELLFHGKILASESFVDLDEIDFVER